MSFKGCDLYISVFSINVRMNCSEKIYYQKETPEVFYRKKGVQNKALALMEYHSKISEMQNANQF